MASIDSNDENDPDDPDGGDDESNNSDRAADTYNQPGDIAIFEIPKDSNRKPGDYVKEIRNTHPRIKAVLEKKGERNGIFRLRKMKRAKKKRSISASGSFA